MIQVDSAIREIAEISIGDIIDGTSSTLMVAETVRLDPDTVEDNLYASSYCDDRISCPWGKFWEDMNTIVTAHGINSGSGESNPGVESKHPGRCNVLFADGHISFIGETINQAVLETLTTRAGEEVISDNGF